MSEEITQLKQDFTEGLSQISKFWGFPKGMGAVFAVLYLSPTPLSLDELVEQTGLTKGAISTEIRALARMGLVHRSAKLGDRIRGTAKITRKTRSIVFISGELAVEGKTIMTATGLWKILGSD